jgi:hypothetical protein
MGVVGRLDQYASMLASEFDDYSMSENLLTYSEQFDNTSGWNITSGVSVSANTTIAPDGTLTADTVTITGGSHALRQLVSVTQNTQYTFSFYVKRGTATALSYSVYNWTTLSEFISPTSYYSQTSASSWARISVTFITPSGCTSIQVYPFRDGSATGTAFVWGAQLERGSVPTDYTPTTTTAINRVLASTTNTNITGLGTYYSSGFYENVGFTTFLSANVFPPYDPVYDEFSGTSFGAGQGRYMRQNTDKSVIVYNEIDEISDFRDIVRSGLVLDLDAGMNASFNNTGTTWNDLSGNGNNGTLVLGPTYSSANGGSIVFDGTNDYSTSTSVTNSLTTLQKEGSLTYEYWIKPTASIKLGYTESNSGSSFYSPGNATPQGLSGDLAYNYGDGGSIYVGFGFAFGTNGFVAGVHKNGYAPTILVDYQTYNGISHLVVIKNATNCSYYVNGVLKKASLTIAGGATIIGDTMSFVANSAGAFMNVFKGDIYSVKFYNRALTAAEILQNYNALKHRFGL